jgi:hypothetical protein
MKKAHGFHRKSMPGRSPEMRNTIKQERRKRSVVPTTTKNMRRIKVGVSRKKCCFLLIAVMI